MPVRRQRFSFSDTGTFGDTGPPFHGSIEQLRWNPSSDTGAALVLSMIPKLGDTGDGWVFWNDTGKLRTDYVRAPRQSMHLSADATSDTGWAKVVGAGDRIRAKITVQGTSTATVAGRLYIWTKD